MLLDVIALAILAGFVGLGAWRGALVSGTNVVALMLAYGGGIVAAGRLAEPLAARLAIADSKRRTPPALRASDLVTLRDSLSVTSSLV